MLRQSLLGVIYGIFNRFSLYRYEVDMHKRVDCGKCSRACRMDVDVCKTHKAQRIRCGRCVNACPAGAIHSTFSEPRGFVKEQSGDKADKTK